jgi:hypothetical protein
VDEIVLPENWSPGLDGNSQFTNNESRVLREMNKVYYSSDEEKDRESQSLKALLSPF